MIVKILQPSDSDSFPAIKYNEDKVREGVAERVEIRNFEKYVMDNPDLMTTAKLQNELSKYSSKNTRVKRPQFHVTFSGKGKTMTCDDLMDFANKWLEQMGYSRNPLVFYFHRDTDNNHLHVVTSRVGPDGRKIDHNHERRRSQEAIARILGIDRRKEVEDLVSKALAYSFDGIGQFRSILETSGYGSQEEGETLNVTKGGTVQCRIPMDRIKVSFKLYDDEEERRKRKAQIRLWLLRYKAYCFKHEDLEKLMREKFGIALVYGVGGKEFSPYGYTIVDHPMKKVYKGSDVVPLKELIEYMPLSREEKEKDIDFVIDSLIERNHFITTEELNRALAKEVDARVWNGSLFLNGKEQPLRENHARILRENDRLRWVQEFNPRTRGGGAGLGGIVRCEHELPEHRQECEAGRRGPAHTGKGGRPELVSLVRGFQPQGSGIRNSGARRQALRRLRGGQGDLLSQGCGHRGPSEGIHVPGEGHGGRFAHRHWRQERRGGNRCRQRGLSSCGEGG